MTNSIISIADSTIETIDDSSKDASLNSTPIDDTDSGMDHADYSSSETSNSSAVTAIAAGKVQESDSLVHHQNLLDVIALALDHLPSSSDENDQIDDKFVEDLRMRQKQREIELEKIALQNAGLLKCDHEQNAEFKCLAYIDGDTDDHMKVHEGSHYQHQGVCAFCGASFGSPTQFKHHLGEHHGGFTVAENNKYKLFKSNIIDN